MKIFQASKKALYISSLMLGTILLTTPGIAFAGTTNYANTAGENATLSVTDNFANSIFNIQAAGSCGNSTVWTYFVPNPLNLTDINRGCLAIPVVSINYPTIETKYILAIGGFFIGSPGQGEFTEYPGYGPVGAYTFLSDTILQQCPLVGYGPGCVNGYETLASYLAALHSIYMFTGIGDNTHVNLNGGLTSDTFSIMIPGVGSSVWINTGLGGATYNIIVGPTGTVTIDALHSAGAYNYYNIVY